MGWETARKDPVYGRAEWRRARDNCLREANWRCQIRLDGCQGAATEADHTDQLGNDPRHKRLRAACTSCHRKVTAQQGNDARRMRRRDPSVQTRTTW